MSEAKLKLLELEKSGKFLFHGTGEMLDSLEPRQAYDGGPDNRIEDGKPAVYATPSIDYAIFMAVINKRNCPRGFRFGTDTDPDGSEAGYRLHFWATKETLDQVRGESYGWVHVLPKEDFTAQKHLSEFMCYHHVAPSQVIKVFKEDLPYGIEIR